MESQLYLILGIIINDVSWAMICCGWYQQKALAGIESGIPFVWDKTLIYYVAIIPAIIGIEFIIHGWKLNQAENKKNKKSLQKRKQTFDNTNNKDVKLNQGEGEYGRNKNNRSAHKRAKQAGTKERTDRR